MDSGASSEVSSPQPPSGMSANSVGMGQMSPRSSPSSRPSLVGSPQHQQNSGLDPSKGFDDQRSYIDDEDSRSPIASSAANMCMAAAGTPVTSSSHESLSGAAVVGSPSPPPPMLPLSLAASKASFGSLAGPGIPSMVPGIYKSLDQHHHRPSIYNSPPPSQTVQGPNAGGHATADMGANECKLIDYRGAKIAAFIVNGETLLCLPQAFELFLKHLVGGLHTVYTKLKRLEVTPIVCNVEQVRILRGLGAIQPGVNRCKLLSCKDFDLLYKDCTTASSRPGRPPKRASLLGMSPTHHTSDSAALLKAKKCRMDNGDFLGYENGHITAEFLRAAEQLEKNPLLANGYSHHAAAAAQVAAAAAHIGSLPFIPISSHHGGGMGHQGSNLLSPTSTMSNSSHHHHHLTGMLPRRTTDVSTTKEHRSFSGSIEGSVTSARSKEDRCDGSEKERLFNNSYDHHRMKESSYPNGSANGHSSVLNLSQNNRGGGIGDHSGSEGNFNEVGDDEDDDNDSEEEDEDDREHDLSDNPDVSSTGLLDKGSANGSNAGISITGALSADSLGISSIETLLRNIQGLLKVAADNARQQERQANYEKAELKMEVLREREMREGLEKQLVEEQRIRVLYQKRIKKEKRIKRRLQEELELENKRRVQYEEALRNTSSETLRIMNESFYKTFTAA